MQGGRKGLVQICRKTFYQVSIREVSLSYFTGLPDFKNINEETKYYLFSKWIMRN